MHAWIAAFRNSCAGLAFAVRSERAVRQEVICLFFATPLALVIGQTMWTRIAMIGVILIVISVELLNTCVEKLSDHVTPEIHPQIKIVKDTSSAAVLAALALAVIVWLGAILERLSLV